MFQSVQNMHILKRTVANVYFMHVSLTLLCGKNFFLCIMTTSPILTVRRNAYPFNLKVSRDLQYCLSIFHITYLHSNENECYMTVLFCLCAFAVPCNCRDSCHCCARGRFEISELCNVFSMSIPATRLLVLCMLSAIQISVPIWPTSYE